MISDKQPHTYKDKGHKFYAFFENYEFREEGYETLSGFHFYIFDQQGFCWEHSINPTRKWIEDKAYGFFLERPAWETDGCLIRDPLERYMHIAEDDAELAYALEAVNFRLGLDLTLILKGDNTCT